MNNFAPDRQEDLHVSISAAHQPAPQQPTERLTKTRALSKKKKDGQQPEWTKTIARVVADNGDDYDDADEQQPATKPKTKRYSASKKILTTAIAVDPESQDYCVQIVPQPGDAPFDSNELVYAT
jgi:hypothetical protein